MAEDVTYKQGDSLWTLTRKILVGFTQGTFSISTSGGGGGGGGGAVTIADGADVTLGAKADALAGPLPGSYSLISLTKAIMNELVNGIVDVNVLNTVNVGSVSTITNPVTVSQATAANLNATVAQATAANLNATVVQPTAANLNATVVQATAANLNATVAQATASNLNATVVGNVGGKTFSLRVTPTISTSAYTAGFTVGGIQTLTSAVTVTSGTGILESLIITDTSNQKAPFDIFIFESNPAAATTTDHAAFTFSTDIGKVIARIAVLSTDYVTVGSVSYATALKSGLGVVLKANGGQNLFAVAVTSGTPTYGTTTSLNFVFGILQD